jgi:predicted transcriptional regulator
LGILADVLESKFLKHPLLQKYTALVNEDLTATYSRDILKWLLVAPTIGVLAGLIAELSGMAVRNVMQRRVISVQAISTIRDFVASVAAHHRHTIFPVHEADKVAGTISVSDLSRVQPEDWDKVTVGEIADRDAIRVMEDCDLSEALRLLMRERGAQVLLVTDEAGTLQGVVTKTDILRAVRMSSEPMRH